MNRRPLALVLLGIVAGCGASNPPTEPTINPNRARHLGAQITPAWHELTTSPITHVVIVIQENRTPDNLFRGLPGADTTPAQPLTPVNLVTTYDVGHSHTAFLSQYNGGRMDGFLLQTLSYVPQAQVQPYFTMAEQYAFADRMFQGNQGPSYPGHQYLISGASTILDGSSWRIAENPGGGGIGGPIHQGGCDSASYVRVGILSTTGKRQSVFPCFDRTTLADLVVAKGLTWRYYQAFAGAGIWQPFDSIKHIRYSTQYDNVVAPSSQFLTDVAQGNLANVTWITPTQANSDHAKVNLGGGPAWVTSVVNAIGNSQFWSTTAIFVVWDDWGGWYDHVAPLVRNNNEMGFRVPLIVISPYAKRGFVSHQLHEFGSILRFTEEALGLGSLNTTDTVPDDLSDCFDFDQTARLYGGISPATQQPNVPVEAGAQVEDGD